MIQKGKVVSFSSDFSGWSVMFSYMCSCGSTHDSQAFNVWPTGSHLTDVVKSMCPNTNEPIEVELVRA
jgi:hypothetical protein